MTFLLDTHILLWIALFPERLPVVAQALLADPYTRGVFSVASIWEVSIKHGLGRSDFQVDPRALRRNLLDNGYTELEITSQHAFAVSALPPLHRDPFDRILLAQAGTEGITLLTLDPQVAQYPGPVRQV